MNETSPITELKGVGEKTAKVYARAGIMSIGDLLHYFPRDYRTFEDIVSVQDVKEGNEYAVYAKIEKPLSVRYVRRLRITDAFVSDETGHLNLVWYNMPYLKNTLKAGAWYVFLGKAVRKKQQLTLEQPAVFLLEDYQKKKDVLEPVYPLTDGMTNHSIQKMVTEALKETVLEPEYIPEYIREEYTLAEYNYALEQIHRPKDRHHLNAARRRLVFDEFFLFILAVRQLKKGNGKLKEGFHMKLSKKTAEIIHHLGFTLTGAQQKVWQEIEKDMTSSFLMSRLVQGDVGSGKTILAFLALFLTVENGWQGTMMVPTEVLARQHYEALTNLIEKQKLSYEVTLLTGAMTAKEKREAVEKIASGDTDIIIGTHAVFQEKVNYDRLALVITDEQHRFGVRQREALSEKGERPHILVMSATPIPRTLAVIIYGDLDISVVNELPANRLPIKNCVVGTGYRPKAYQFIQKEVEAGHQAYVICPMVEESEMIEAEDVLSYTEHLKSCLPETILIACLHGKMKASEKNEIMNRYLNREIQVLVSTTVIEVGVNVPNATVMMIENAERFGLAQLHQLRGRVGRGAAQSYCIMCYGMDSKKTKERLEILNHSNDGFYIAEQDLKLRGPGDLFGIRQSGVLDFAIGDVFQDADILAQASKAAEMVLESEQFPDGESCHSLTKRLEHYMFRTGDSLNL